MLMVQLAILQRPLSLISLTCYFHLILMLQLISVPVDVGEP